MHPHKMYDDDDDDDPDLLSSPDIWNCASYSQHNGLQYEQKYTMRSF